MFLNNILNHKSGDMVTNIISVSMEKDSLAALQHKLNNKCLCKFIQMLKYKLFHVDLLFSSKLQSILLRISIF